MLCLTEVFHSKHLKELFFRPFECTFTVTCQKQIITIQGDDQEVPFVPSHIESWVAWITDKS